MITYAEERRGDAPARERLLDAAFGPQRFRKTCQKLRRGRLAADGLSFSAHEDGKLVGTLRLWHVRSRSGHDMLLLGPLAVDAAYRSEGIGGKLTRLAIAEAQARGHGAILLVGDAPYYARFGFSHDVVADVALPGPVEVDRLLGLELQPGALAGASGLVTATGAREVRGASVREAGLRTAPGMAAAA